MNRIYIEAGNPNTSEYVFVSTLLKQLQIGNCEIICVGGWTKLSKCANKFQETTIEGGVNLIIFDADFNNNNGGFAVRKDALIQTIKDNGLTADLFLFPNNQDDGCFETLLEEIARKDLHGVVFDCFADYERCVESSGYVSPNLKGKIFTYISAQPMSYSKRDLLGSGKWQFDNKDYWDMDSQVLNSLKDFLISNLMCNICK